MKNWRKANAILIAALVAAATILGGCGGSGESGTPTAETAEKAPTEESDAAPEKDAQEESEEISAASEDHKRGDGVKLTIFCDFQEAARSQYTAL